MSLWKDKLCHNLNTSVIHVNIDMYLESSQKLFKIADETSEI